MSANTSKAPLLQLVPTGEGIEPPETERVDVSMDSIAGPDGKIHLGVSHDQAKYDAKKPSTLEYLQHAQKKSGRSPLDLTREFVRLYRGRGKLTFPEYVQYGVFDTSRYSSDEQSQFLSNTLHWLITGICCDMTWQASTEDKWLCSHILESSGIRIPQNLAVIDKSDRIYIGTQKIGTATQLRDFLGSQDIREFFGKENRGICSFGAFLIEDANETAVLVKGHGWLSHEKLMEQLVGETPYLLQQIQTNHEFFSRFTASLATVRVCILLDKSGIKIPFAVLKLPSSANFADNFWRPGNLACKLDVSTGEILSVRSKDVFGTTEHTEHPETGTKMIGEVLPMWDLVLGLVRRCSPIFQPIRYQSMDIAITKDGPVLIEINTGGGFDLPQLASGQGFLTEEVIEFFRSCGYKKL